jgi:hypothetical protein
MGHFAAHHQFDDLINRRSRDWHLGNQAAVAQDRGGLADAEHLAHLVGLIDDRHALRRQAVDYGDQFSKFDGVSDEVSSSIAMMRA